MLKNFEILILNNNKEPEFIDAGNHVVLNDKESFNLDFTGIAYFYFLKIKKIKISGCSYLKIIIKNIKEKREIEFTCYENVLGLHWNHDFANYLILDKKEKKSLQLQLIQFCLRELFHNYKLDSSLLNTIDDEIRANDNEMRILAWRKRIEKKYWLSFILICDIDSFTFFADINEKKQITRLLIFKSVPISFVIYLLFKKFNIENGKLYMGTETEPIFEIDLVEKKVTILEKAKHIIDKYRFVPIQ